MKFIGSVNCEVRYEEAENDEGISVPCVYVRCPTTGTEVGPVWGQHERSIKRALAMLAGECTCGCFHQQRQARTPPPRLNSFLNGPAPTLENYADPMLSPRDY